MVSFTRGPADLQLAIQADARATARVLSYLDGLGVEHSGVISGATLAAVCGVDSRTWRRWVSGDRQMPRVAVRLLQLVAWPQWGR